MRLILQPAHARDVPELVVFRTAVNLHLAHQHGEGFWLARSTEKGALAGMKRGRVFIGRWRGKIIASLTLSTRKPWAIDATYFHPSESRSVSDGHGGRSAASGRRRGENVYGGSPADRDGVAGGRDSPGRMGRSGWCRRVLSEVRLSRGGAGGVPEDAADLFRVAAVNPATKTLAEETDSPASRRSAQ